jgi:3-phenylpropionate/trans-cinnamate dioxygenase ferredoxin subunit
MSLLKKYNWHKVAASVADISLTSGGIAEVNIEGKEICLGPFNGQWYGFAATCPHAGGAMLDGYIDGACRVVCTIHQLRFNLKNGHDSNGEGYKLKTYPVEVREDGVYVGVEESRFKLF